MVRYNRLVFILLAFYFVFVGSGVYYEFFPPVRYLTHILMTLLLGTWLLRRIRRGQGLPYTPLNPLIYILILAWGAAAALGLDPRVSFESLWFMLIHVLILFVLVDMSQHGQQRIMMEAQFLLAALVVMLALLELVSWYFGLGITPTTRVGWISVGIIPLELTRLSLPFGVSTWLAAYTAPLVIVTAGWAMTTPRRDFRVVLWLLSGALLLTLILTFSRGGLLACVASIIALIILHARLSWRTLAGVATVITVAGLVVLLLSRTPERVSGDTSRFELWRSGVRMVGASPLVGVGPAMFGRGLHLYADPAFATDHLAAAHNFYINLAAEMGLLGVAIGLGLLGLLVRACWQNWRSTIQSGERLRQSAIYAALLGVAVQFLFDNFALTSVVSVYLVLLAYALGQSKSSRLSPRWTTIAALTLLIGYAVWLAPVDVALNNWQGGMRSEEVDEAQTAVSLDPAFHLYPISASYLAAQNPSDLPSAIDTYEQAVEIDPEWDIGWLNLAALAERQGDITGALTYLDRARAISQFSPASLHWGRLSEQEETASDEDITAAYLLALQNNRYNITPPTSPFWSATPLRARALDTYIAAQSLDVQYRLVRVHHPDALASLRPSNPATSAEWWVQGETALTVEDQAEQAIASFSEAIGLDRVNGDYYASRARAYRQVGDLTAAERDLKLAELLGTIYEYPNAIRAGMAEAPEDVYRFRVLALPPLRTNQHFASVLYARQAQFDLLAEVRYPGPGSQAMQPWYDIAATYAANGEADRAITAYRAILDYAPDEIQAHQELTRLGVE